jgi:hypothetical protein
VARRAGDGVHGRRLRGLIVVLWRAGLRIHEALALAEATWTSGADRCWSGAARAAGAASRDGRLGLGAARALARRARRAAGRTTVLRRQRPNARAALVGRRGALGAAPHGARGRRATGRWRSSVWGQRRRFAGGRLPRCGSARQEHWVALRNVPGVEPRIDGPEVRVGLVARNASSADEIGLLAARCSKPG